MPSKIRRRENGAYTLSVAVGYDAQGKQLVKTRTVFVSSRREAEKEYVAFAAEVQKGTIAYTGKYRLREYAQEWFDGYCKKKLAPKTQAAYWNHIEKRIIPELGYIELKELRPQHILRFVAMLEEGDIRFDGRPGKLSSQSAVYCFRVLSSMLQDAVQWQLIPFNPCTRVKPPSAERHKAPSFDEGNVEKMLLALEGEPLKYRTVIMLALESGLRLGELMGLQWDDIDFDTAMLHVRRSNQAMKGRGIYTKKPKTEMSVREIAMSDHMVELLGQYREWQEGQRTLLGNHWKEGGWLFTQWNGLPMYPTTPSGWFRDFLKRHDLPHIPFHALRHLSATLLIAFGVPLKNVSSRLGHADIRTTANIYTTALKSVDRQAAKQMGHYWDHINKNGNVNGEGADGGQLDDGTVQITC